MSQILAMPWSKEDDEQLTILMEDILPYIRFPIMGMNDIASKIQPTNLLSDEQIMELYTYMGKKLVGQKPKLPKCLKFGVKERKGRAPPVWFKWDPNKKHSGCVLSKDGLLITTSQTTYQPTFGNISLAKGVHEWEIFCKQLYTDTYACTIGVVPANNTGWNNSHMIGYSGHINGWAFSCGHAQKYNYSMTPYGKNAKTGDTIKVKLDCDKKTLEFFHNGKSMGVAFTNVSPPVRPAVSCYGPNSILLQFPRSTGK